jgi:lipopolysaccharide transport system ATP-binding protein
MSQPLVEAQGVSKKFCRSLKRSLWYGLQDMAREAIGGGLHDRLRKEEFWAVNDVSFQLRRGECLSLIGHNGAGKTTLLKMLNGLIKPDLGRIVMRGRVGALIALGAGFNPILTGRENIYVNGSILGLSRREIDERLDAIIDFAEIGDFIDTPVQAYSSGMQVRLGFAVSTAMDPDILILDEVLAVGDAAFRAKCYSRIGALLPRTAIIFVSHDMNHVAQISDRAIHLSRGAIRRAGDVPAVIASYLEEAASSSAGARSIERLDAPIESYEVKAPSTVRSGGDPLQVKVAFRSHGEAKDCLLRVVIADIAQVAIAEWNSEAVGAPVHIQPGLNTFEISLGALKLRDGRYSLDVYLYDHTHLRPLAFIRDRFPLEITGIGRIPSHVLLSS